MSESTTRVIPFVGAGELRLGMTREEVTASTGLPDEVSESGGEVGERREVWEYTSHGWSLDFDEEDDWRLVGIDLYRPSVESIELHGLSDAEACAAWNDAGLPELDYDDDMEELGTGIWRCEPLQLVLWFTDGAFEYLSVGPRWSEDGESIVWPEVG